jgi:hypothetical protein
MIIRILRTQHPIPDYQDNETIETQHPIPDYQDNETQHPIPDYQDNETIETQHPIPDYQDNETIETQHPIPDYQDNETRRIACNNGASPCWIKTVEQEAYTQGYCAKGCVGLAPTWVIERKKLEEIGINFMIWHKLNLE